MFNTGSLLLSKSGLSADSANKLLAGKGVLDGLGSAFLDVENKYGVNTYFGIAQAALETGWGTSAIARDFNNLFGITAYDSNPYGDASHYNSPADCVEYWGEFLKNEYLTQGGAYYVSPTPSGVARHWASDPNYASKIVSIMNLLLSEVQPAEAPAPAPSPTPPVAPNANTHVVQNGENMSVVAQHYGLTLRQLEAMNPHAGHPAGNYDDIWAGDVLNVGAFPSTPPTPSAEYYTVQKNDNLSTIAERHGISLAEIEQLNPQIKNPDFITPGESIRI